jgi:hypothetical protein
MLDGQGDVEAITKKLGVPFGRRPNPEWVRSKLHFLESIGYISSSLPESSKKSEDTTKKIYQLEVFGERALKEQPISLEADGLKNRALFAVVLFGLENINSMYFRVEILYWPFQIAVVAAVIWTLIGAYQVRQVGLRWASFESTKADKR